MSESDLKTSNEIHNPWREFIENVISGKNYFRASEYHDLLADLDRLYALEEKHAPVKAQWRGHCECKWDATSSRVVEVHPACKFHANTNETGRSYPEYTNAIGDAGHKYMQRCDGRISSGFFYWHELWDVLNAAARLQQETNPSVWPRLEFGPFCGCCTRNKITLGLPPDTRYSPAQLPAKAAPPLTVDEEWENAKTQMSEQKTTARREWHFDRYRNGKLMAQGVKVHAVNYAEAYEKAVTMLFTDGNKPTDELRIAQNGG